MRTRTTVAALAACLSLCPSAARAADTASGSVAVQKMPPITARFAVAYPIRESRDARKQAIEILLTDVAIDRAPMLSALEPHMVAINAEPLKDRNYIILNVVDTGQVFMNATYSKSMTQFIYDSGEQLVITWTTRTPTRLEGTLASKAPLRTMDGTTYTVNLTFGVDVPAPPAGQALAAGGGEPGKALSALIAAIGRKNWTQIKPALTAHALELHERSYNTPAENAADLAMMADLWFPKGTKVTRGQLFGDMATLDTEAEMFPGTNGLTRVRMKKTGTVWQFDEAVRAGMVPAK